jgi:hypothetical protein
MKQQDAIQLFENKKVRTVWDSEQEKWFISIIDVIEILTESPNARKYWSVLKLRLRREGSELTTNCSQLKMQSSDGKFYKTDVADTEQLFRLIQSIPSPKAVHPETFEENKKVAQQGGNVAKVALKELEAKTGKKVVSALNAKSLMEANKKINQ